LKTAIKLITSTAQRLQYNKRCKQALKETENKEKKKNNWKQQDARN
jgi:hypothetical protein